jgi:hypothetical protein
VFPDPGTAVDVMYGPLIAEVGTTPASISIGPHICARIADTQAMAPLDYIVCRQHGYVLEYRIMEHQLPAHASVLERMTDTFNVR